MSTRRTAALPPIEVRAFKWPRRAGGVTQARLLGADEFGRWLGVAAGDPWWQADGLRTGVFDGPLVKVVPDGTYWSACFYPVDPLVDVDIVLPVTWIDDVLEEVDLELDVLRYADGSVRVRDQDEFARVREMWDMPDEVAAQAEATCEQIRALVEARTEPFGEVGREWLERFLT
jgi:uncharacterized protein